MDLAFTDSLPAIKAIIQFVQAGQEGGRALADVLSGEVTPSGKNGRHLGAGLQRLPHAEYFSFQSGNVYKEEYKEGIYVGYRYFDTFEVPVRLLLSATASPMQISP